MQAEILHKFTLGSSSPAKITDFICQPDRVRPTSAPTQETRTHSTSNALGVVTKVGYYADTTPKLIIAIGKDNLYPFTIGGGVHYTAIRTFNGNRLAAGLRTTTRAVAVMVYSDILDSVGDQARLTDALYNLGIEATNRVRLSLETRHSCIFIPSGERLKPSQITGRIL